MYVCVGRGMCEACPAEGLLPVLLPFLHSPAPFPHLWPKQVLLAKYEQLQVGMAHLVAMSADANLMSTR